MELSPTCSSQKVSTINWCYSKALWQQVSIKAERKHHPVLERKSCSISNLSRYYAWE